jgi:hypothetical protein
VLGAACPALARSSNTFRSWAAAGVRISLGGLDLRGRANWLFSALRIHGQGEFTVKRIDTIYIVIGALYLVIGMLLGILMGARQDMQFAPVHAHINLVGFSAHCVFGLVYKLWPQLKAGALAAVQFWLFVLGSPVFMVGIAITIRAGSPILTIVGSLLVFLGALFFLLITGRGLLCQQ